MGFGGRTISSKKMMQGAAARAVANSPRTARSLSPSHCGTNVLSPSVPLYCTSFPAPPARYAPAAADPTHCHPEFPHAMMVPATT